jgi:integrase
VRSRFSQFFNWAIKFKHTTLNPCSGIEIELPSKDPEILTVEECKHLMKVCEDKHKDLTLYTAICLFAGLRPTECKLLKWEQIHLEEKQITVLHGTTKVKETRNVPIEENLMQWLHNYKGERKGLVTPHTKANLRPRLERLRVDAGYKLLGENPDGKVWVEDVLRHTYASYWLGRTKDRSHLAENMGTSLKMIKKHYKQVVSASSTAAFWAITPTAKR